MALFGKEEYDLLIALNAEAEARGKVVDDLLEKVDAQKQEIDSLKMVIGNMVWASSKVALFVGSCFGGLVCVGYWLMDALHWKAVIAFFKTLRGE
jgi:hypothetical protein